MALPIIFRTTDNTKWGAGNGAALSSSEVDLNFWYIKQAVEDLQVTVPDAAIGIATITAEGSDMYVELTNGDIQGPFAMPVSTWVFRGDWMADTAYNTNDVVNVNTAVYLVTYSHVSGTSFDEGANDGLGHGYYIKMLDLRNTALPSAGTVGQVLKKASGDDYDVLWADEAGGGGGSGTSLTMAITYTGAELLPDLNSSPISWIIGDSVWTPGQLSFEMTTGSEDPSINIPIEGLVVDQWYLITIDADVTGDWCTYTMGNAVSSGDIPGRATITFKATDTTDYITLDLWTYAIGSIRNIYSVSCKAIDLPTVITINDGVNDIGQIGAPNRNILIGAMTGRYANEYGANVYYTKDIIAIGYGALESSVSVNESVAIGTNALRSSLSSRLNVAIGQNCFVSNTASENTAVGAYAGYNVTGGGQSVFIGYQSGAGSESNGLSVFIGAHSNSGGGNSGGQVAIGAYASAPKFGDYNVSIGYQAGYANAGTGGATADNNVFIGHNADSSVGKNAITNAVAIGYNALVSYDNCIQLGNANVKKAYIGTKAVGLPKHLLVAGAAAGNVTATGIKTGDRLDEVIYYPAAGGISDLTTEFTISATDTINNSAGTASTGGSLMIRWTSLT